MRIGALELGLPKTDLGDMRKPCENSNGVQTNMTMYVQETQGPLGRDSIKEQTDIGVCVGGLRDLGWSSIGGQVTMGDSDGERLG